WQVGDDVGTAWLSQSDLATKLDLSRQRVGQAVASARERWIRFPAITALRQAICEILNSQAGVATHDELIAAVLLTRGSTFEEPKRTQMASVAVRAAIEM